MQKAGSHHLASSLKSERLPGDNLIVHPEAGVQQSWSTVLKRVSAKDGEIQRFLQKACINEP